MSKKIYFVRYEDLDEDGNKRDVDPFYLARGALSESSVVVHDKDIKECMIFVDPAQAREALNSKRLSHYRKNSSVVSYTGEINE